MDELLVEFINDLNHIKGIIDLKDTVEEISSIKIENDFGREKYCKFVELQKISLESKLGSRMIPGIIIPYLGGRFENFVKNIFEDLSLTIASNVDEYKNLPRDMRENLISYTAEVISRPRKYGHGDGGVESFIKTLSMNVNGNDLSSINTSCLSITYENMRPEVLKSLFERIGMKEVWKGISEQFELKSFLGQSESHEVKKLAEKHLREFMDKRNMIAHPSNDLTWPDSKEIIFYINFLKSLSKSLVIACKTYSINYVKKEEYSPS